MNEVIGAPFFFEHVGGLFMRDIQRFNSAKEPDNLPIVDEWAVLQKLANEFVAQRFTLADLVPVAMHGGVVRDPRIQLAASKKAFEELRTVFGQTLAMQTNNVCSVDECLQLADRGAISAHNKQK